MFVIRGPVQPVDIPEQKGKKQYYGGKNEDHDRPVNWGNQISAQPLEKTRKTGPGRYESKFHAAFERFLAVNPLYKLIGNNFRLVLY